MRVPWTWLTVALGGLTLAIVLVAVGLESADKVASVVGGLAGLVSVGLALSSARRPGRGAGPLPGAAPHRIYTNAGVHHGNVTNVTVGGSVVTALLAVVLVAALVFGLLYLLVIRSDGAQANDEALKLVDFEYATDAVPVKWKADPRSDLQPGEEPAGTGPRRPLVVSLRNPTGDTAVLTAVKVVVHEVFSGLGCGTPAGGGLNPSYDFAFRFPAELSPPWQQVNPQNFTVAPHDVDALSVTIGPDRAEGISYLWWYSIYAVSETGNEAYWGDAIGSDAADVPADNLRDLIWGETYPHGAVSRDDVRACAARQRDELTAFLAPRARRPPVIQPEASQLLAEYQRAAAA